MEQSVVFKVPNRSWTEKVGQSGFTVVTVKKKKVEKTDDLKMTK